MTTELHDKQVTIEFTVERTETKRMTVKFVTTLPDYVMGFQYNNVNQLLKYLVERMPTSEANWRDVGSVKVDYQVTSYKEL